MTELLRVYEELIVPHQEYCVICFRSGSERRMLNLQTLELFIKSINLPCNFLYTFQRICWVCERAVAAAYRTRLAVNLSASVHNLFSRMDRSKQKAADLAMQLRGDTAPKGIVAQALGWQERLAAVRARSTLLHTEVLVVASVPPSETVTSLVSEVDESDVYLIPDASPRASPRAPPPRPAAQYDLSPAAPSPPSSRPRPHTPDELSEPEIFMDSVIIEDDEQDPIEIKQEEPVTDDIDDVIRAPRVTTSDGQSTTRHSYVTTRDGHFTTCDSHVTTRVGNSATRDSHVTTSASHVTTCDSNVTRDGHATKTVENPQYTSIVPIDKLMNATDNTSFLLHPIVDTNGIMAVPSLNAQIINGQLMTIDNASFVIQTPKLALHNGVNFDFVTEPDQVKTLLTYMNKNDLSKTSVVSDNIPYVLNNNLGNMTKTSVVSDNILYHLLNNNSGNMTKTSVVSDNIAYVVNNNLSNMEPSSFNINGVAQNQDIQALMSVKPYSNNNIITHSIIMDDDDGDGKSKDGMRQIDADGGSRKRERDKKEEGTLKKQKETDWEDKIPMDVISYVDATDPNADQMLREPSMGIISAVHSVTEEAHSAMNNVNSSRPGITGAQSGMSGAQTEISDSQLVTTGLRTYSRSSGIISLVSGINSVQTGINSAQTGINNTQCGINSVNLTNSAHLSVNSGTGLSVQPGMINVQSLINNVVTGNNSIQSVINSVQPGINSVQPGINSTQNGINCTQVGISRVTQIKNTTRTPAKGTQKARPRVVKSHHRNKANKLANKLAAKNPSDIIDLC